MTIEKKFIKNRAFKNLMAHVCAHSLTVAPGLISAASLTFTFENKEMLGMLFGLPLILIGVAAGVGQFIALLTKFADKNKALNIPFQVNTWKDDQVIKEIQIKEKEVEKMTLAVRDLSIENNHFTPQNYDQIAGVLIDKQFYKATLRAWIESHGAVARSSTRMLFDTGLEKFYGEIDKIVKRMDQNLLKEAEKRVLAEKIKSMPTHELLPVGLNQVRVPTTDNVERVMEQNQEIYDHHVYFSTHNASPDLIQSDYNHFSEIFKRDKYAPQISIIQLVDFLKTQSDRVNWSDVIERFKNNFTGDIDFYGKTLKTLLEEEKKHQSTYEIAQMSANLNKTENAAPRQPLHSLNSLNSLNSSLSSTSLPPPLKEEGSHELSRTASLEPLPPQKEIKRCNHVNHMPNFHPDKWAELKLHYDTMMAHTNQIDATTLGQMNEVLNSSLPVLIMADVNLKRFPHLYPEGAKKLISDNLELAVTQIQSVNETISEGLMRDLKVTKNYQTMKVSR